MRILIITAYDRRKASLGHQFAAHVKSCFKSLRHSHEQFTFIVRRHSELGEFVPDPIAAAGDAAASVQSAFEYGPKYGQ